MVPHQCNQAEQFENIALPAVFRQHEGNFGELKKIVLTGFETLPNVMSVFQLWKVTLEPSLQ